MEINRSFNGVVKKTTQGRKRVFAFGHPNVDSVIERFLNGSASSDSNSHALVENNFPNTPDYNRHYSHLSRELEVEKKRKEVIDESKRVDAGDDGFWWDAAVDCLELDELELYMTALEELMKNVNMKANDHMLLQNSSSLGVGAPMTGLNPTIEPYSFDDTLLNQNQISNYDYGNYMVPYGDFGQLG
ncbi:unnamed protein product [Fraxinus pennsylvanica]|uniref:Agamous-like MADS-box protein AGL62 n=1 Tax=Fraxinus pennsylvanica TaxID=56036 RepID=A0AAD2EGW8_9LAMI|nr:unnamed protein product [Fraxinus pennsylvanica]